MKINHLFLFGISLIGIASITAQEKKTLTLDEAIQIAWTKSNEINLANTKVNTKNYELQSAKNNQYPDFKLSGQYQRLTSASVKMAKNDPNAAPTPSPDQVILGQATVSLPLFSGFKIKNEIKLSDNLYQAENANAAQTKENIVMRVVNYYTSLYKAQKTIAILTENQKSTQQRVTDFIELEKNGIIPRNDLLKAQLLVSRTKIAIEEAKNNLNTINFYLTTLLQLDPNTKLAVKESDLFNLKTGNTITSDAEAIENRKDLEAIHFQQKASEANIKIAKSGYYPSISLLGGYTALDLKNIVTVNNAMNFGVGVSYNIGGILKNKAHVKIAESKALEYKSTEAILVDQIKNEVQKAIEDYSLAINQSEVYEEAVQQSAENYRIVKDKFDNGLSDTNDLVDADVENLSAQINTAVSKATIIQKYYELLSVTGQIAHSFNLATAIGTKN